MNTELKELINVAFDMVKLGEDGIQKNYVVLVSDALSLVGDMPGAIANWGDLMNEIKALQNQANEQDLLSYIEQKLSLIPALSSAKPQAVMAALIGLINAAYALEQAFAS